MVYKKRKTKRFRNSKKAQENMNLDIEQISGGSYKIKRKIKKRKTRKFKSSLKGQENMNLDIQSIS